MGETSQPQFLLQGDVYEVEKLVGVKIVNGKKLYRVRWQGYSAQNDTLEPEENLLSCKDMIAELEAKLEKKRLEKQMRNAAQRGEKVVQETEAGSSSESSSKQPATAAAAAVAAGGGGTKDTFWRDFSEGKIVVSDKDMYSKVKERAARALAQSDKGSQSCQKEGQRLVCPKVVLKRRINPKNANALPTYKSTLQIKQVSFRVKRRKKYDVLRDYRKRRSRNIRKCKVDENKNTNQSKLENSQSSALYQGMGKPRNISSLMKNDSQSHENMSSEFPKVLQELSSNDEMGSGSEFPPPVTSNGSSKAFFRDADKLFTNHSPPKDGFGSQSVAGAKDAHKIEQKRKLETGKDTKYLYKAISSLSFNSGPNCSGKSRSNTGSGANASNTSKTDVPLSKLNVVTLQQIEGWGSLRLRGTVLLEKALGSDRPVQAEILNRHGFDLLMSSSVQCQIDIIEKLCSRGMPLNCSKEDGTTPMMILSQMGLHDVIRILLRYSAHKDKQNRYGETALMLACRHRRSKVVKLLLEYGANFALTNIDGISAIRISNRYASKTDIPTIMNEHISRIKLEFEIQARNAIDRFADIKYALFPLHCFSLSEGPRFSINFSHHEQLVSPGKSGKAFLLCIANCTIKGNIVRCVFHGVSSVSHVDLNGMRQESFTKGNNFFFRISCLRTGNNEIVINAAHYPQSEVKLIICAYRVHYRRMSYNQSSETILTPHPYH